MPTLKCLSALLLLYAVGACVPNKMYRRTDVPDTAGQPPTYHPANYFSREQLNTRDFEPASTTDDPGPWKYRLAFVEFDDQGELFKREQLRRAVQEVMAAKELARRNGTRAILAIFVHGWKNNASEQSGNVWGFRQVLAGLAKQYSASGPQSDPMCIATTPPPQGLAAPEGCPVIGVYVGWRGAVLSPPILKEFTIFDREQKSQNLTGAHLVDALLQITQAAKGPRYDEPASAATVLIGHSFGGAVLETVLTQTLLGLSEQAKAASAPMRWPADLIMFVNEAQEAGRSYQLLESFWQNLPERDIAYPDAGGASPGNKPTSRPNGCVPPAVASQSDRQQNYAPEPPAIVSISSTADQATRLAFVGAHSLERPFHSLRTYDSDDPNFLGFTRQTPMFLNTTAHRKEFRSHLLSRCQCRGAVDSASNRCLDPQDLVCEDPDVEAARKACKVYGETTLGGTTYLLVEQPQTKNRTPYWVLHMPPSMVPDHSTIFTPIFRNFIISLLNRATRQPPSQ